MSVVKSILGAIALVIYSFIVKFIIFLLIFCGVRSGWGWFLVFFGQAIWVSALFSAYPYFLIVEWTKESRFSVTFAAVIITLCNFLNILALVLKISDNAVLACLHILAEIVQIIFVIWVCAYTYREKSYQTTKS